MFDKCEKNRNTKPANPRISDAKISYPNVSRVLGWPVNATTTSGIPSRTIFNRRKAMSVVQPRFTILRGLASEKTRFDPRLIMNTDGPRMYRYRNTRPTS